MTPHSATPTTAPLVSFTFSEAVSGFDLADIAATGGTVSALTTTDNITWSATFTATDGFSGTGSVSVANNSYTDLALNPGTGDSDSVAIDTTNPSLLVNIVDASLSDSDNSSLVSFTFSEAVSGFDLADIAATGGTVSALTTTDNITWSATFTATDGFSGTGSVSVANSSYTDLALNPGTGDSDSVAIDTTNPSLLVNIVDASLSDSDNTSPVSFTFSEAVSGFDLADIAATGGTVSALTTTDNISWSATFTATDGFSGTGSVSVANNSYTDLALNPGTGDSDSVAIDTTNPSLLVNIVDASLSDSDNSSLVSFTFSEAVSGFDLADIAATGGSVSALTTTDNISWSATFTATDGFSGTGSVSVANSSYTDLALNPGTGDSDSVAIDTTNPSLLVNIVDASLSDSDNSSLVSFTFSEAVTGFDLADIAATGGTVSALTTTDNITWSATFTATDGFSGTGSVSVANNSYTDLALNPGTGDSDSVAIDTTNPSLLVNIVDASLSDSDNSSLVSFTFSEAVSGFDLADIAATGGTVSALTTTDNITWSATFTATDGFSGTGSVSVANNSYTDLALNPGTGDSDSVAIDTTNPSLLVNIVDASLSDSDNSSLVSFTFSEAVSGFDLADIAATGGTVSALTTTDNITWSATFTATDGFSGTGSVSVANNSYTDLALNPGTGDSDSVAIDTTNPSLLVNIVDASLSDSDNSSLVSFTFSEAVSGFDLADIAATGGTVSALTTTDNITWSATFTATDGFSGTGSVSVANNSYTDLALNPGTGDSDSVAIDTTNPSLLVNIVDASLSDSDNSSLVSFTFSEAVSGFDLADIAATGGTVSALTTTDNITWSATFTATDGFSGTGSVSVANNSYTDLALNPGTGDSDSVAIDTTNPSLLVNIVDASLSDSDNSSLVSFTFSEAVSGFDLADIAATGGTVSALTTTDNITWSATFTATDGFSGTGSVSVANNSYTDLALNPGTGDSDSVAIDTTNPSLLVNIVDASLSDSDNSSLVSFTFSEAVSGFDLADIAATGGTVSALTTTDNITWSATFTATDGFSGTGSVSVANNSYTDLALNPGTGDSDSVAIDTTNPSLLVNIVDASLSDSDNSSLVSFTFSEAVSGFDLADIAATGGTVSALTTTDNITWSATFTATDGFSGTGSVSVANNSYTDLALNPGTGDSDSVAIDTTNPSLLVNIVDASLSDSDNSSLVSFTFSEAVSGFDLADIAATGGTVSALTTTDNITWSATFTATDGFSGTGSVSVANNSYTDLALNPGTGDSDSVAIDTTNPSLLVNIVDASLSDSDNSSTRLLHLLGGRLRL